MSESQDHSRIAFPALGVIVIIALVLGLSGGMVQAAAPNSTSVFINEFHYDNTGTDTGEFIEVAGPAGTDLSGWRLVLYNGNGGTVYADDLLSGQIPDQQDGFGTAFLSYPSNGIQNGSPDGIALVDPADAVIQFLSYEGTFTAVGGPADGMTSTDIGVSEDSGTPVGFSLQLIGTGSTYEEFTWTGPTDQSAGSVNAGQTFVNPGGNMPIVPVCGGPISINQGSGAERDITASDADGIVTEAILDSVVPPTTAISLVDVVPATTVGGTLSATLVVSNTLSAGSYAAVIGFANDDPTPQTAQCTINVNVTTSLPIYEIQGTGQYSPYAGQTVMTSGVVTLISANGADMWIQDPNGDGDPATSDGIFVDDRNQMSPPPQVGDYVVIQGVVDELQFGTQLPLTQIDDTQLIDTLSQGNPLPAPVELTDLPDTYISDGIAFWEPLEGMRVSLHYATVVGPTNAFGEFVALTSNDAVPGSGYYVRTKQILLRDLGGGSVDYNPERIMVDDQSIDDPIIVKPGDSVSSLVGVLDYTFGNYKIQPDTYALRTRSYPTPPVSTRSGRMGNLRVTTFNVENLFDLIDNPNKDDDIPTPQELETKLTKLTQAIEQELLLPEIIVVQEVENVSITQVLGDRVNAANGTNYMAASYETSDVRGIEVGFLWDANRVTLLDAFQLDDSIVPGVSEAFGPDSASPGREPLVGFFDVGNGPFKPLIIVGNHFKSKGGDDPLFGVNDPPIRITEVQRKLQAHVVRDYVNLLFDDDPTAWVMIAGDLNDFQFGEPGEGPDHPLAILGGTTGEVPMTDLINFEVPAERFTYVYDGNSQVLDHMLISPGLMSRFADADILHFDAGFPNVLADDPSTTLHASDHDPIEGRFNIGRSVGYQ